jgi:integrase
MKRRERRKAENEKPEWRLSLKAFYDSPAGRELLVVRAKQASDRARVGWDEGGGMVAGFLRKRALPLTRQRWGGRQNATKPPGPLARPRGRPPVVVTKDQIDEIAKLAKQGWGRRAIATRVRVGEGKVRKLLVELGLRAS